MADIHCLILMLVHEVQRFINFDKTLKCIIPFIFLSYNVFPCFSTSSMVWKDSCLGVVHFAFRLPGTPKETKSRTDIFRYHKSVYWWYLDQRYPSSIRIQEKIVSLQEKKMKLIAPIVHVYLCS